MVENAGRFLAKQQLWALGDGPRDGNTPPSTSTLICLASRRPPAGLPLQGGGDLLPDAHAAGAGFDGDEVVQPAHVRQRSDALLGSRYFLAPVHLAGQHDSPILDHDLHLVVRHQLLSRKDVAAA